MHTHQNKIHSSKMLIKNKEKNISVKIGEVQS